MRGLQVNGKLEVPKGERAWLPHEEPPAIILEQQLMWRLSGIVGRESETILGDGRDKGHKSFLYHSMYWSALHRCTKPTLLHLE